MEEAIYLTRFASKVTVVHRRDTLRASKIMQDKAFANPKIEFIWDSEVADVHDVGKGEVTGIVVRNLKTGQLSELPLDGVFIAIGHTPNTSLFEGQIELDANGYIVTHARHRRRACRVCLRRATCRITSTARRSPPPARAAWPRSTPSATSKGCSTAPFAAPRAAAADDAA